MPPKADNNEIRRLLERLQEVNRVSDGDEGMAQELEPPTTDLTDVPSLQKGVYLPLSPMVRERFRFAGSWKNAGLGQRWLSLSEMRTAWTNRSIQKQIRTRQEHWENAIVAKFPPERLALFGFDADIGDETYLAWTDTRKEPQVILYSDYDEERFKDLKACLRYLIRS